MRDAECAMLPHLEAGEVRRRHGLLPVLYRTSNYYQHSENCQSEKGLPGFSETRFTYRARQVYRVGRQVPSSQGSKGQCQRFPSTI